MKLNTQTLDATVEKHFETLKHRVDNRLKGINSPEWLLTPHNSLPYQPDYLTMGSAGRTSFEQQVNRVFSRMFPSLWFKTFFPKVSKGLITYTEQEYFQKIFTFVTDASLVAEIKKCILSSMRKILSRNWYNLTKCTFTEISNCMLAVIHEPLHQLPIEQDVFIKDKEVQNKACLELIDKIERQFLPSESRLNTLVYLCCRSNWIDSLEDNVHDLIKTFIEEIDRNWVQQHTFSDNFADSKFFQMNRFIQVIDETSGPVLYEADNCGEIVFDLCLIEELIHRGRKVNLCLKECPMVNDAMIKDVEPLLATSRFSELGKALQQGKLDLLTAGPFVGGGKLPHVINEEYKTAYVESDLVIIKGQGNFQSMPMGLTKKGRFIPYDYGKPVVFMTGIKAEMIQMCLTTLFPRKAKPTANSLLLYVYEGFQK